MANSTSIGKLISSDLRVIFLLKYLRSGFIFRVSDFKKGCFGSRKFSAIFLDHRNFFWNNIKSAFSVCLYRHAGIFFWSRHFRAAVAGVKKKKIFQVIK